MIIENTEINKKKTMGGGEDDNDKVETVVDRDRRLQNESLYDQALELYESHQEGKKKKAVDREKDRQLQIDLAAVGKPSRDAAMGKMAEHIHFEEVTNTDSSDESCAQKRARQRRDDRRTRADKRKSQIFVDAFAPLCKVMRETNAQNEQSWREDLKFRRKQSKIDNKLTAIMCMMMGKDYLTDQQKKGLFDLTNDLSDDE